MRKTFLLILCAMFICVEIVANCASTRSVSVDYENARVTFELTWAACDNNTHRNQVWVFVDYQEVRNNAPYGDWKPAMVTGVYSLTPVTVSSQTVTGNTRGVWITGSNGAKATVTLQLDKSKMPIQYKWCAFATDYPPNAATYNNGIYALRGTAPFVINGMQTSNNKIYSSGTINTITDATGCPGWIERDVPTSSGTCRTNLTLVGGYCRDLNADGAVKITGCGNELEVELINRTAKYSYGSAITGCPSGWRIATRAEVICFANNSLCSTIGGCSVAYVTTTAGSWGHLANLSWCTNCSAYEYLSMPHTSSGDWCGECNTCGSKYDLHWFCYSNGNVMQAKCVR